MNELVCLALNSGKETIVINDGFLFCDIRIYKFLVKKIEPQRHNAAIAAHKKDGKEIDRTSL
jgi:hypothetical protein